MTELAAAVIEEIESGKNNFTPLYDWNMSITDKIEKIAKEIYGADGVDYSKQALTDLKRIDDLDLNHLPI